MQLIYCKHAHTHTVVEEPGQGGEMGKAGRQDSRPLKKDPEEAGMWAPFTVTMEFVPTTQPPKLGIFLHNCTHTLVGKEKVNNYGQHLELHHCATSVVQVKQLLHAKQKQCVFDEIWTLGI